MHCADEKTGFEIMAEPILKLRLSDDGLFFTLQIF